MSLILSALLASAAQAAGTAQTPPPPASAASAVSAEARADAAALMRALEGAWRCQGAFANGRPLEADLSFRRSADGQVLQFVHVDRAPNTYRQHSHWALDNATGRFVSLAFAAFGVTPQTNGALYVAEAWTRNRVTLVHQRLFTDPFAPNRFTYTVEGDRLHKLWEVQRQPGQWQMGDYLNCTRQGGG